MLVPVKMSKDVYEAYAEDMYAKASERSGNFGKIRAKVHKKYDIDLFGTKEDRKPRPVTIIKGGKTIIVPVQYLTKTGAIKKSGLAYINTMLNNL